MNSILFVNQSSGYLMVDIVNAFVDSGKYDQVEFFVGEINIRPSIPRKSVHVIKTIGYNKANIIRRLFSWICAFIHLLFVVWRRGRNCELFLVSNPPLTIFIPLFTRKKFSILVYDLYPDSLYAQNFISEKSWLSKIWKGVNKNVFTKAEHVFTISDDMKRSVSRYVSPDKIKVVYNWAHNEHLKPIEKSENPFLKELGLQDKFIVLYSGNMGMSHDIDMVVDVAAKLIDYDNIRFLFIGDGAKKNIIKEKIEKYNLNNCLLLPFQSLDILPYSMGAADIAVITTDMKQTGLSVPSKTYSYLAIGAVLLCLADESSELGEMVNNNKIGRCFTSLDITGMVTFILEMVHNEGLINEYKVNACNLALHYTPENAKQYLN